ncbi:alpha/beta-Hydrolases superfamily protein [Perilla frutescens var. hirtella]|uniref:Alpha/beta-Hydrolases superfamily protein n=1 Tax=Perilla frutescens var. hirtella TaxID=608512 RepID=A0AAD4P5X0_PERFH|nr:alpha/beta-Hydrolases superfamily protein [Perilla frutescens var. hirtella]
MKIEKFMVQTGLRNNTDDYQKLALILKDYGVPTVTAKVSRIDWLRNATGLLDSNYWRAPSGLARFLIGISREQKKLSMRQRD